MDLNDRLNDLVLLSQERYKFIENPDGFIKRKCEWYKAGLDYGRTQLHKRLFQTTKSFQKKLELYDKKIDEQYKAYCYSLKKLSKEALIPVYVYYKGNKIVVPDNFYKSFSDADTVTFLEYLEEDDRKKNIITDEDREKARLLNCNLDYTYLQTLMNMTVGNPDLVITVQTKDAAVITLRTNKKLEPDVLENEVYVKPTLVR